MTASSSCLLRVPQRSALHSPPLVRLSRQQGRTKTGALPCTLPTGVAFPLTQRRHTKRGKLPALEVYVWSALQEAVWLSGNPKGLTTGSEYLMLQAPVARVVLSTALDSVVRLTLPSARQGWIASTWGSVKGSVRCTICSSYSVWISGSVNPSSFARMSVVSSPIAGAPRQMRPGVRDIFGTTP